MLMIKRLMQRAKTGKDKIISYGVNRMFIAEIGINHNGDIELAKRLIKMAKDAGADVVKFQKRDIDICVPVNMRNLARQTPWGEMSYIDYKRKLEFSKNEYVLLDAYCRHLGIKWTASVWDTPSLEFIASFLIPFIKIPSASITDINLLRAVRNYDLPVVMSTGMSTLHEIKKAVHILSNCDLTILHCNSSYPTTDTELDLKAIETLKRLFPKQKIGYSGHEKGIYATIAAKVLGAEVIERHITLDKSMWGTDQGASLNGDELCELIRVLNKIPSWLGDNKIKVYKSEMIVKEKLRRIAN